MKISVVTVCLNASGALPPTIESVLKQDWPVEYIVVDGGSTDGTLGVLDRYRGRIALVVSGPDEGISDAFNKGIRLASGEVVGILNAGDSYETGVFESVAHAFDSDPACDVIHGDCIYADANGRHLYQMTPDLRRGIIWKKMPFHHPTCFVRKTAYEQYGLFDCSYSVAMDYELMLRFWRRGAKFRYMERDIAVMRLSGMSDKNWFCSIRESRRAAMSHGRNWALATLTAGGRTARTAMTVLLARCMGQTLRERFPAFRGQRRPLAGALLCCYEIVRNCSRSLTRGGIRKSLC